MKKIMLGNEAVARGLYEAGVRFVSSYPGTPSTEISEFAAKYDEIYAEWAPNEKVALEAALGAAIGGGRSFCAMKHVGLNVAADPLFITSYTGINAGMVIAVADDPGMHSSQNEQDSRYYAISAKLPMLEPSNSSECVDFVKIAYEMSEEYNTPVILRLTTRVSHAGSPVDESPREEREIMPYVKDPAKYVMMPSNARGRHTVAEKRLTSLRELSEKIHINRVIRGNNSTGIITSGNCYNYAKECFGNNASYLKLGMINPLPKQLIADFAASVDRIVVIEELDGIIESFCNSIGIKVDGKNLLPIIGEYSDELLEACLLCNEAEFTEVSCDIPPRPPVLCPGCPHRGVFYTLSKMKLLVSGDIGCYTLGAAPPLNAMDTTLCMGASISALHGIEKVRGSASKSVAVIGDSTFMHSGMTGLVNTVYNGGVSTILILDNSITGMTGHQQNPLTGKTLKGNAAPNLYPEEICAALGVDKKHIRVVDPNELSELEKTIKEELSSDEVSVIICRRPCALLPEVRAIKTPPFSVDPNRCIGCGACMKPGCPCISMNENKKAQIDQTLCTGCRLCEQLCPKGAIAVN